MGFEGKGNKFVKALTAALGAFSPASKVDAAVAPEVAAYKARHPNFFYFEPVDKEIKDREHMRMKEDARLSAILYEKNKTEFDALKKEIQQILNNPERKLEREELLTDPFPKGSGEYLRFQEELLGPSILTQKLLVEIEWMKDRHKNDSLHVKFVADPDLATISRLTDLNELFGQFFILHPTSLQRRVLAENLLHWQDFAPLEPEELISLKG